MKTIGIICLYILINVYDSYAILVLSFLRQKIRKYRVLVAMMSLLVKRHKHDTSVADLLALV